MPSFEYLLPGDSRHPGGPGVLRLDVPAASHPAHLPLRRGRTEARAAGPAHPQQSTACPRSPATSCERSKSYTFSALTASIDGEVQLRAARRPTQTERSVGQLRIPMSAQVRHQRRAAPPGRASRRLCGRTPTSATRPSRSCSSWTWASKRCQQMFADLNRYAVRPTTSLSILYDHADEDAQIAKALLQKVPVFTDLTETPAQHHLQPLDQALHAQRHLPRHADPAGGARGRAARDAGRTLAAAFWNEVAKHIPDWGLAKERKVSAADLRRDYIHAHTLALAALARAGSDLAAPSTRGTGSRSWPSSRSLDWSRSNTQALGRTGHERRPALEEDRQRHPDRQRHQEAPGAQALRRGAAAGERLPEEPQWPKHLKTRPAAPPPSPGTAWPRPSSALCEEIRELYLADAIPGSSATAAARIPAPSSSWSGSPSASCRPTERSKPIHVISTDTLVEQPLVAAWVETSLDRMRDGGTRAGDADHAAQAHPGGRGLVLGQPDRPGLPGPAPEVPLVHRAAQDQAVQQVHPRGRAADTARPSSSSAPARPRARGGPPTIEKHAARRVRERLVPNASLPNSLVYTPIEDWNNDDVWLYLMQVKNPWGHDNKSLLGMYQGATEGGECPLVVDSTTPSCGSSRFGCWVCTVVDKDRSMEAMIKNDEEKVWMTPLLELRNELDEPDDRDSATSAG